jgi:hypothetical protein
LATSGTSAARSISSFCVRQRRHARAAELEHAATAAAHTAATKKLQDHVLRLDPGARELVLELDADDLGAWELERVPGHADSHVEPACSDGDHRAGARLGGVAVRADERFARCGEPLAVDVVTDAVAGTGEPGAVLGCHRLEEAVVVRVLEVDLKDVVVDIDDRGLDLNALDFEELELHQRHRPGRVLGERLVDAQPDLRARDELSADEVLLEDRAGKGGHSTPV